MSANYVAFPSFNFPRSSTRNKGQAVVDYGIDDVIDVNICNHELNWNSRKSIKQCESEYNTSKLVCFPLCKPNIQPDAPCYQELQDCWINPHDFKSYRMNNYIKTTNKQQLNRLFTDDPEILIGSISDQMTLEDKQIIGRHFHPLRYSYDIALRYGSRTYRRKPSKLEDYRLMFKDELLYQARRYDKKFTSNLKFLENFDKLMGTLFEIPRDLLLDYLDEGLIDQYDLIMENLQLGNCLSFCEDYILYPKDGLDVLRIDPVCTSSSSMDGFEDNDFSLMELNTSLGQSIHLNGVIQELCCHSYETGQALIGVRSGYSCTLLSKDNKESMHMTEGDQNLFKVCDTVDTESRVLSLTVNPYYEGDAVIALEDGTIYNWTDGLLIGVHSELTNKRCTCDELFWVHCCYGSSPKSLIVVHSEEVQLLDMRSCQRSCRPLLKLPNVHVNRMDKLTRAAFIHPVNPHQLLLSSEQSLIIMDERFTNSPVIAINHSMRSSPRFMQTWTYEKESSLHTMAFLAGYKHRDTRCLEFEQSSLANNWTSLQTNSLSTNPVTCTRKPWRLAYCDSWLEKYSSDSRILSPAIETRLKQPLVGFGVYPVKNASHDLFAVQLTKSGDLFYELLTRQPRNGCEELAGAKTRASGHAFDEKLKQKCHEWVSMAFDSYNDKPLLNECAKVHSEKVGFDEGAIVNALEMQKENFEIFCKQDLNRLGSTFVETEGPVTMDIGDVAEEQCGQPLKHHHQSMDCNKEAEADPLNNESEANDVDEHGEASIKNCRICFFPVQLDEQECSCCKTDVRSAEGLIQISKEEKTLLTNNSLGKSLDVSFPKLVKNPENSKDPLSTVLLVNWDNDNVYTPIDLSETGRENDDGFVEKKPKIVSSLEVDKTLNDTDDEPGWFLNESGNLEFRDKSSLPSSKSPKSSLKMPKLPSKTPGSQWETLESQFETSNLLSKTSMLKSKTPRVQQKKPIMGSRTTRSQQEARKSQSKRSNVNLKGLKSKLKKPKSQSKTPKSHPKKQKSRFKTPEFIDTDSSESTETETELPKLTDRESDSNEDSIDGAENSFGECADSSITLRRSARFKTNRSYVESDIVDSPEESDYDKTEIEVTKKKCKATTKKPGVSENTDSINTTKREINKMKDDATKKKSKATDKKHEVTKKNLEVTVNTNSVNGNTREVNKSEDGPTENSEVTDKEYEVTKENFEVTRTKREVTRTKGSAPEEPRSDFATRVIERLAPEFSTPLVASEDLKLRLTNQNDTPENKGQCINNSFTAQALEACSFEQPLIDSKFQVKERLGSASSTPQRELILENKNARKSRGNTTHESEGEHANDLTFATTGTLCKICPRDQPLTDSASDIIKRLGSGRETPKRARCGSSVPRKSDHKNNSTAQSKVTPRGQSHIEFTSQFTEKNDSAIGSPRTFPCATSSPTRLDHPSGTIEHNVIRTLNFELSPNHTTSQLDAERHTGISNSFRTPLKDDRNLKNTVSRSQFKRATFAGSPRKKKTPRVIGF